MNLSINLSPLHKRAAIVGAAVILVAGVVAGRERPSLEITQSRPVAAANDGIDLAKLKRGEASQPQNDPFSRKGFEGQQAVSVVNEKPAAPPLPFRYFGRLTENGKTETFVMLGDELLSLASGQKHGEYRVDQVSATRISFTYLPLKTKQTLELQ